MKLFLDARFWRPETGGIGRYSRELLAELLRLQTDDTFHVLITPSDEPSFALRDPRLTPIVADIPHYSLAEQWALPRLIDRLQPDLVHFLNFNQPVLSYRGRRVTTVHDLTVKYFPVGRSQRDPIRRWAFNRVLSQAARSDRVIAISRATKADLVRELKADPEKIDVVYEGASAIFQPASAEHLVAFKRSHELTKPYILFVNQWRPHKGMPELLSAFAELKARLGSDHELVITGQANRHFPELATTIDRSPVRSAIRLPGFVSDEELPLYYAGAAAMVFPSHYEGFGLGVLEAMRCGAPVITTNVSSLPEVAGDAALYYAPGDIQGLVARLEQIVQTPGLADALRQRGLQQAAKFSWEATARETYAVYRRALAN